MPDYFVQIMGVDRGPVPLSQLQAMVADGSVKPTTLVRVADGQWFAATEVPGLYSTREWLVALLLSVFVGHFGVDRFYVGDVGLGVVKLLTFGGCGVWTLIDVILIACDKMNDSEGRKLKR